MTIDSFFYSRPIFRYEEFAQWKKEQGAVSSRAAEKALLYYKKAGRLLNIHRGLYVVVPPNESAESISVDPYLLASKAANDSVLGYHTALELHGVAYSVFEQFTFLTGQKNKPFEFQNRWFQPTAIPLALKKINKDDFGVEKMNRQGLTVRVTNAARTYVDVLDRVELSGGWEEILRSISNLVVLNVEEVITYCLMLHNRILAAKVGFFLEQRQGAFKVEDNMLEPLLKLKPRSPQYLTDNRNERCQLVKKWNLIISSRILNQSWDEPDYDV
jgi:predicted transcriptional regulator of viral defense system